MRPAMGVGRSSRVRRRCERVATVRGRGMVVKSNPGVEAADGGMKNF